jgi:hypothetical protein
MSAWERFVEQCSRMFAGATLLLCLAAPAAFAAPITYTLSGPVSGTLGATPFTNAQITIVATGDTSTADCGAPIFCNTLSSVTFTINGVGSGTVTDGLSIFDGTTGALGLERTTGGLVDWIDHDAVQFQTFNLATSLGPITVVPRTPQGAVATTAGSLNLTSGPTTFQSVVTGGGPTATTTAVISSLNPSVVGQSVTFTATVTGSSPTGTVQFKDGTSNLGAPVTLSGGSAALTTAALTQGTHSITAVFSGDANNATSTSFAVVQIVNASVVPPPLTNQPIPTLSEWGMILLVMLLGALGIARLRSRRGKTD